MFDQSNRADLARDGLEPVEGIEPHDGYVLCVSDPHLGDPAQCYWAVGRGERHLLHVSSYGFTPTQARFAWLVDWGFPQGCHYRGSDVHGPLTNAIIDYAMVRAVKAKLPELHRPQLSESAAFHWHTRPQARAIIARIVEAEFRWTGAAYNALTDRAERHFERLEALRREAMLEIASKLDGAACPDIPSVNAVLQAAFAMRRTQVAA